MHGPFCQCRGCRLEREHPSLAPRVVEFPKGELDGPEGEPGCDCKLCRRSRAAAGALVGHPLEGAAPVHSPDMRCSWSACKVCFPHAEPDPEIVALETCMRVLFPLDETTRERVLDYLGHRLLISRGGE